MLDQLDPSVPPVSYIAFWVLMLVSFLIGWFAAYYFTKLKYKRDLEVSEAEKLALKQQRPVVAEPVQTTFTVQPVEGIKAVQTRGRSGQPMEPYVKKEAVQEGLPKLNFDSFGKADETQKDDLKLISGVGPFIEKKLNSIGIYTFEQISRFNDDDIETVTDLIEFFPGRIKRDDWKGQAKKLAKAKE